MFRGEDFVQRIDKILCIRTFMFRGEDFIIEYKNVKKQLIYLDNPIKEIHAIRIK
jgi:hypothetical protein